MSSLTTDLIKYRSEIKKNLTGKFEPDWIPLWNYCEMTQILNYAFSFTFLIKKGLQKRKLTYRSWTNNLTGKNQLQTYDLDNIKIDEEEIRFSLNDTFEIQEIIKRDINAIKNKETVLNGFDKQFIDFKINKKITWNLDVEMNANLFLLINKIRKLKST